LLCQLSLALLAKKTTGKRSTKIIAGRTQVFDERGNASGLREEIIARPEFT
jgi:hypothetical protein